VSIVVLFWGFSVYSLCFDIPGVGVAASLAAHFTLFPRLHVYQILWQFVPDDYLKLATYFLSWKPIFGTAFRATFIGHNT